MEGVNYYEFIPFAKKVSEQCWDTTVTKEMFQKYYHILKRKNMKCFKKQYKEYVYSDVVHQNYVDEIKIFRCIPKYMTECGTYIEYAFQKQKLSLANVPSNTSVNVISYVKAYIFRITNRIYVNFHMKYSNIDNSTTYTIFVNYNHDNNVCETGIKKQIESIINVIKN